MSRGDDGQATVELVMLLPLLLLLAVVGATVLAAQAAREEAGMAAEAGALAGIRGADPREAALAALPPGTHAAIEVRGRRVTVHVRPKVPIPVAARLLAAGATAEFGATP